MMTPHIIYVRYPSRGYPEGCLEFQGFKGLRKKAVDLFRTNRVSHSLLHTARDCIYTDAPKESIDGVLQALAKIYTTLSIVDVEQAMEVTHD